MTYGSIPSQIMSGHDQDPGLQHVPARGLMHLLGNMLFLWSFYADNIEATIGPREVPGFYLPAGGLTPVALPIPVQSGSIVPAV